MKLSKSICVKVYPTSMNGSEYCFEINNTQNRPVRNFEMGTYDILGPGDFSLDDTHMPASLTHEERILVDTIDVGEKIKVVRKKWGGLKDYRGKNEFQARARFSDGGDFNGHTINHLINVIILEVYD